MSPSGGAWHCPTCLRSVPPRVETCYCGTSREQAERAARAAAPEASASRTPWIPLVIVALALGVLVLGLRREPPAPPPEAVPTVATPAAPRPPPALHDRPPLAGVARARRPTPVPPAPDPAADVAPQPVPAAAAPAAEPEPPTEEAQPKENDIEARRREARAAFETRLGQLASRRNALGERLRAWDASCGSSSSAVRPAGCVLLQEDVEELVAEIDAGLREAEQQARRDWLQPGERRALLEGLELDSRSWGELRRRASSAMR